MWFGNLVTMDWYVSLFLLLPRSWVNDIGGLSYGSMKVSPHGLDGWPLIISIQVCIFLISLDTIGLTSTF